MRNHNDSIDTTHTPPPLSFYNTFKGRILCNSFPCADGHKTMIIQTNSLSSYIVNWLKEINILFYSILNRLHFQKEISALIQPPPPHPAPGKSGTIWRKLIRCQIAACSFSWWSRSRADKEYIAGINRNKKEMTSVLLLVIETTFQQRIFLKSLHYWSFGQLFSLRRTSRNK
jgi:hypothetical protein